MQPGPTEPRESVGTIDSSLDDGLVEEAAQWIVGLTADALAERERALAGFEAWKQADQRHAAAAARIEQLVDRLQHVRSHGASRPASAALDAALVQRPRSARLRRFAAAVVIAALALPGWFALEAYPPSHILADLRVGIGQWETRTLPDGTQMTLASAAAVNIRFDEDRRTVELVRGEILVDVARDSRPFTVVTGHGRVKPLGTRFVVKRESDATVLSMLKSSAAVYAGRHDLTPDAVLHAGQQVRYMPSGLGPVVEIDSEAMDDAWAHRHLVVKGLPLPEVLDQLNRYRHGHIRFDPDRLVHLKVSAVLPLDDPDRALRLLANSFSELRLRSLTPWLVIVDTTAER